MSGQIMKVHFKLHKGKPNKLGRVPIMAQWKIGGVTKSLSTKLNVLPERWTFERTLGLTKDDKVINAELDRIRMAVMDKFHEMLQRGEIVTAEKLKCAVTGNGYSDKPRSFIEVFDLWLEDYAKSIGITTSKRTFDKYVVVRNRLQLFIKERFNMSDMLLEDVNPKFINDFDTYIRQNYQVAHNHAMKIRQKLRTIFKMAHDNGWVSKNPFAAVKIQYDPVEREVLTKSELTTLMQTDMQIERLDRVRDVFVFCCFTGLAHCDVYSLKPENIVIDDNGQPWIKTSRQKTSVSVDVPLLEIPQMIIAKYKGDKKLRGALLPVLSNDCTNIYLKEVATLCHIKKNLTFHMARHTFATTVALSNGVPIESVSKMLGHRNIRTTQIYAKVMNDKLAEDMSKLATRICGDFNPNMGTSSTQTSQAQHSA